jgi:penicillin amidase
MRLLSAILPLMLTIIIVYLLNKPLGSTPALGVLLDPVNGFWTSAEPVDNDFNAKISLEGAKEEVEVWFDNRLVPHIKAANDYDLYYTQGYIHAYFRLWQMDLQTRAAAGRVSELLGEKALKYDRGQRRKGMVYGAEKKLQAMERNPLTKNALDAYCAGVNQYIASLSKREYPIEYKLMGFAPEEWTNIKTALLLMYMADDLTGDVHDIGLSYYLSNVLTAEEIDFYFPEKVQGSTPVIPLGTQYPAATLQIPQVPTGNVWADIKIPEAPKDNTEDGKGSNNWVVAGARTKSGKPILCNDPHLGLNLPSLWFEVQLTAPGINVYGVSLPGAPGVVIGFNDNISWGFTNNYRDVKDYYAIDVVDNGYYTFNGVSTAFGKRVEVIKIKGKPDVIDTVNYTVHGPVQYDANFEEPNGVQVPLAMKWMAHQESNELISLYLLNRANNYEKFVHAIGYFLCPAQNFIYSDIAGNIALWGQGQYVNKWRGQGKYVMQGKDSSTLWGELIPVSENPHAYNPVQGFLSSANQNVADSTYPYWFNGRFNELRAWRINEVLDTIKNVTVEDMFRLQNDDHSVLARNITPYLLDIVDSNGWGDGEYLQLLKQWNYNYTATSKAATVFQVWWSILYQDIWDVFRQSPDGLLPLPERTMQIMLSNKDELPGLVEKIIISYNKAVDSLNKLETANGIEWYRVKNTSVNHLAKLAPFSFRELKTGGWGNTVNAMKGNHGPSWRMVVEMNEIPQGYGVYPGGQSGNPGSKYYATFLDKWVEGQYYKLSFTAKQQQPPKEQVKYAWHITKAGK